MLPKGLNIWEIEGGGGQNRKYIHTVMDIDYLTGLLVKLLTNLLNNHCP